MKKILMMVCVFTLFTASSYAKDLLDTNGGGPGAKGIATSANSYVTYRATAGSGGYANGADGECMATCSYSLKADKNQALYFYMRSSMNQLDTDDNNLYQVAADGVALTAAIADAHMAEDPTSDTDVYILRGGSSN